MKNLIDIIDLSVEEIDETIKLALDIIKNPTTYSHACDGKVLASLFFEASTRTRLSFESAMIKLGGGVISVPGAQISSISKGESIADTAKIVSCYSDIIAMRNPVEGSAYVLGQNASVPVINAGDGGHCHPTQTTADLLTIYRVMGRLENLKIGLCGDLLYGRTVHSLINAMNRYKGIKYVLISPKELSLPDYLKDKLDSDGVCYEEVESLEDAMPSLDVLYMTRIQRERFSDPAQYERLKNSYCLTKDKMNLAGEDMCLLHPLPRVNEISEKIDEDKRAYYFDQALNGRYMRMALILKLLRDNESFVNSIPAGTARHFVPDYIPEKYKGIAEVNVHKCTNPKCITQTEQELDHISINGRCLFCEQKTI